MTDLFQHKHQSPITTRTRLASLMARFVPDDPRGVHYAVGIFTGTTLLWIIVQKYGDANPIWSISSMVATSDPQVSQALQTFRGRIINTLLGCAVGLIIIALGRTEWQLPFGMALTVLLSSYVVRVPTMWRQAPITAAIVIAGTLRHHEKLSGMEQGARRVGEVLLGCVVGMAVAWFLSKVWPLPPREDVKPATEPRG
ncbi:MAG: FUSC family protein [Steroidobacteraceae bacterium]